MSTANNPFAPENIFAGILIGVIGGILSTFIVAVLTHYIYGGVPNRRRLVSVSCAVAGSIFIVYIILTAVSGPRSVSNVPPTQSQSTPIPTTTPGEVPTQLEPQPTDTTVPPTVSVPPTPLPQPTYTPIIASTPPSQPTFTTVSISSLAKSQWPCNLQLMQGNRTLLGVPFDVGWTITTEHQTFPSSITLAVAFKNPKNVYLLWQGGWAYTQYSGQMVGEVSLSFASGGPLIIPVILGDNIRDWTISDQDAVNTATSPMLQEAWRGREFDVDCQPPFSGREGRMDMLTIDLPESYLGDELVNIEIKDTAPGDPAIHLNGVTVRYIP